MGQVIRGGEQFETHIEADHRGQIIQQGPDSGALDAFGRQRFSQPLEEILVLILLQNGD
jgi:hypothetical protein